jgi:tetratricopeptide (TPR) repeat protein
MYLRTPKRYTGRDDRKRIFNFKWLWLYISAPIVLIIAVVVWDYRAEIAQIVDPFIESKVPQIVFNQPSPTPTVAGATLKVNLSSAFTTGKVETAIETLKAIGSQEPNNAVVFSVQARLIIDHIYTGDASELKMPPIKAQFDQALTAADYAIDANPEVADGWIAKAYVLDAMYQPQAALPYALHAKDIDDKNPLMLAVLAQVYDDLKRYKSATSTADAAIDAAKAQVPVSRTALAHAYYVRAIVAFDALEGSPTALKYLEAAWNVVIQKYTPDNPYDFVPPGYIVSVLGRQYQSDGKGDMALKRYTDAIGIDQEDPYLYYLRGRIYVNLGQFNEATKEFDNCVELDSHQSRCLRNLGILAYNDNNWYNAIKYLQTVADDSSQVANDYYLLGSAYDKAQHQCDKAVPVLQAGYVLANDTDRPTHTDFEAVLNTCNAAPPPPTAIPTTLVPTNVLVTPTPTSPVGLATAPAAGIPTLTPVPPPPK